MLHVHTGGEGSNQCTPPFREGIKGRVQTEFCIEKCLCENTGSPRGGCRLCLPQDEEGLRCQGHVDQPWPVHFLKDFDGHKVAVSCA